MADADGERVALAKIVHELESLKPLITEAKAQSNPDSRIQFQCKRLIISVIPSHKKQCHTTVCD